MRDIQPTLTEELLRHFGDNTKVGSGDAYRVNTFRELVEQTAKLSFKNKDHLLFYRGQAKDYRNKAGGSTFYPSIYRGEYVLHRDMRRKFDVLEGAGKALVDLFEQKEIEGFKELKRRKAVQWSVLQHYEVCDTPYLDFTHSLRVACSFATMENEQDHAYVFVFGLPYLTNRITINSEHDLVNIRLLSICPPTALRPYFQEGYLAGTDEITHNYEHKTELDFNRRLVAKFQIPTAKSFWGDGFDPIPKLSLYPNNDPIFHLCKEIKDLADKGLQTGDIGEFLQKWAELEEKLISHVGDSTSRYPTMLDAIRIVSRESKIDSGMAAKLDSLRRFRNDLVHNPKKLNANQLRDFLQILEEVSSEIRL
jgi:hypothetical protein